ARVHAGWRSDAFDDPIDESYVQCAIRFFFRIWIGGKNFRIGRWSAQRETAASSAMRSAGMVVAAHVVRKREIFFTRGPRDADCAAAIPEFGATVRLGNFRARVRNAAAMQQTPRRTVANLIGVIVPPKWTVRARIVHLRHVAGLRETNVEATKHSGDASIQPVPDDLAVFIFIEAQIEESFREAP